MIEGLRLLPEVQTRRTKQQDSGSAADFLDCDACMDNLTEHDRRCLGCGFLPESKHHAGDRPFPEASVCPGYLVRLPEVTEAARALVWSKRGGVEPLYGRGRLPQALVDCVDVLDGARNDVEARTFRERQEEARRGAE